MKRRGVRRRGARTVDSGQVGEGLDIPARLHLCLAGFHAAFASRRGRDPSDHQPRAGHLVVRRFGFLRGVAVAAVGRRGIRGGVRGGHRVAGKRKRARRVGDAKGGCDLGCRRARLGVVVRSSERFATSLFEHPVTLRMIARLSLALDDLTSIRPPRAMLRRAARLCAARGWVSGRWRIDPSGRIARTSRSGSRPLHARAGDDSRPGVYGLRGLHAPEDFARLASAATATSESIARDVRAGLRKGVDVIDDLDDISDAVCSVVDVAELCRNTHQDPRWVRAAENAYVKLQAYVHALNADRGLYLALKETHERHLRAVEETRRQSNGLSARASNATNGRAPVVPTQTKKKKSDLLSPEAARVALTLRRDFERGGIHLDDTKRTILESASFDVVRHGMAFQRNLLDPNALGSIDIEKSELRGLPPSFVSKLFKSAAAGDDGKKNATRVRVPLDQRTLGACMRWVESGVTREKVYKAAYGGPEANRETLTSLIRARGEVARVLGFDSHASYATAPLMAKTPEAVRLTLNAAMDATNDRLVREREHMAKFFPGKGKGKGEMEEARAVRSWDRAFLAGRARDAASSSSSSSSSSSASAYFSMRGVVEGVSRLAERVFGVTLTLTRVLPGEAWCDDARKVFVEDAETGEPLGVVYLDIAPRPGKFPHAAHFVVRCSRSARKKKTSKKDVEGGVVRDVDEKKTSDPSERTLPSVALVCNFGSPGGSFDSTHLTHSEVETFMHELGHAMHSVLSRTEYQHLSGTRCAADLVEVPSHVFEYFAWDADAVKLLSAHRVTGDPMPPELLRHLRTRKDLFAATDLRQQLVFASVDLETHAMGTGTNGDDGLGNKITHESIRDIAARVGEEGFFPRGAGAGAGAGEKNAELDCAWELRFGHVVGYASTYYSYVYARLIAASIWETHFAGGALEPGAGRRLTEGVFKFGGGVAPEALVRDLLGPNSLKDVAGGIAPDNAAALRELENGEKGFF